MSTITFRYLTNEEEKDMHYKYGGILVNVDGIDYLLDDDVYFKFEDCIYHIHCSYSNYDLYCDSYIELHRSNAAFEVKYCVVDFRDPNALHTISGDELDIVAEHIRNNAVMYIPEKVFVCNIVKDNYDNFLDQYYDLSDNIRNTDDVNRLFETTCEEVESLLDNIEKASSEKEWVQLQTEIDSILNKVRIYLNIL
jgi:hypothetical protein